MGEGCQRQTLQDKTDAVALLRLAQDAEGVIDVPLTIADGTHQRCRKIIGRQNLFQNSILFGVVKISHLRIIPFQFGVKWWKNSIFDTLRIEIYKPCRNNPIFFLIIS